MASAAIHQKDITAETLDAYLALIQEHSQDEQDHVKNPSPGPCAKLANMILTQTKRRFCWRTTSKRTAIKHRSGLKGRHQRAREPGQSPRTHAADFC